MRRQSGFWDMDERDARLSEGGAGKAGYGGSVRGFSRRPIDRDTRCQDSNIAGERLQCLCGQNNNR